MTELTRGPSARGVAGQRRLSLTERRERRSAIDDPALVLAAAARYLEVRSRSVSETRRHLLDAGFRPELVAGAVDRLVELGLLDDDAFARAWVASRDRARPRGERALRRELQVKGIADETIRAILAARHDGLEERLDARGVPMPDVSGARADNVDEEDPDGTEGADERAARRLLEKRRAMLGRVVDARVRRQRAYALLARNGFDPDVASRVAESFVRDVTG